MIEFLINAIRKIIMFTDRLFFFLFDTTFRSVDIANIQVKFKKTFHGWPSCLPSFILLLFIKLYICFYDVFF